MNHRFNRRDFLKLAGLLPLGYAAPRVLRTLNTPPSLQEKNRNVIVVVFDAFSAHHLSMFGYQRETTPNLARLAERAVVYHNHIAGSNFTTSGTASLLTGTLPWTHRAFQPGGETAPDFAARNLFGAFPDYYRIAYTHNGWANTLLEQFRGEIDELVPWKSLFLDSYEGFVQGLFGNDTDIASVGWTRNVNVRQEGYAYSLFLSQLFAALQKYSRAELKQNFPRGFPATGGVGSEFLLDTAVDWVGNRLPQIPQPFVGYFHFLPPHGPYNTSLGFYNRFYQDGFAPAGKPEDIFSIRVPEAALLKRRTEYDEFLLYVDANFGRLFETLEASGLLDNSWLVFTSDHGEMFERGIIGHSSNTLYQPVIRVPLLIFEPGRTAGAHVHAPTSAVDVLPTMLHLTGHPVPDWIEGALLPPYAEPDPNRNVYAARATKNGQQSPLTRASTTLIQERYKLLYYFGYPERGVDELVQLYDLQADPEELTDLSASHTGIADGLLDELKTRLAEVDRPYL
jgi:hypothetical protein